MFKPEDLSGNTHSEMVNYKTTVGPGVFQGGQQEGDSIEFTPTEDASLHGMKYLGKDRALDHGSEFEGGEEKSEKAA